MRGIAILSVIVVALTSTGFAAEIGLEVLERFLVRGEVGLAITVSPIVPKEMAGWEDVSQTKSDVGGALQVGYLVGPVILGIETGFLRTLYEWSCSEFLGWWGSIEASEKLEGLPILAISEFRKEIEHEHIGLMIPRVQVGVGTVITRRETSTTSVWGTQTWEETSEETKAKFAFMVAPGLEFKIKQFALGWAIKYYCILTDPATQQLGVMFTFRRVFEAQDFE